MIELRSKNERSFERKINKKSLLLNQNVLFKRIQNTKW